MTLPDTALAPLSAQRVTGWTSPAVAEQRMSAFASPLVGIVRRLFERTHDVDELHAYSYGSEAANARLLLGTPSNLNNGGAGITATGARLAAIGEAVERYSGAYVPFESLEYGSYRTLTARGLHCLSPDKYTPFADWQYDEPGAPFVRFTAGLEIPWVHSRRLADQEPVWIPAQLVYLRSDLMDVNPIGYPTSNGLAYGCTADEALVSAILELAERDAVMIAWYRSLSLPLLDTDAEPELAGFLARHVDPTGLRVSLVDLSSVNGVPVVLAVVRNDATAAAPLGLGAAANGSPLRAATKAAVEAVSTRAWALVKSRNGGTVDPGLDFAESVRGFDDHIGLYTGPVLIPRTRFLDASPHRRALTDVPALPSAQPAELRDALISTLAADGADLYAVDVTSPDVREGGGHVVKVFSPQLQPLDAGYRRRYLGGPRLNSKAAALGFAADAALNPLPHPFP